MTKQQFDLSGRYALVTGGTGYLGFAMCRSLGLAGAHILVNSRDEESAMNCIDQLAVDGILATPAIFDVCDTQSVKLYIKERGNVPLHILVNNAYKGTGGTIETSTSDQFQAAFDVGVLAVQNILQAFLPSLRAAKAESGDASVINISSMYGLVSPNLKVYNTAEGSNPPFYGAIKAALAQYTRYAACEFGPEGIRVNAIAPGPFPSLEVQEHSAEFVGRLADRVPMGRVGKASEMGGPVTFLASREASFVTGAVLTVDGGWTIW